jgi:hypothetical protein
VQVTDTAEGTNTAIGAGIPNQGDGILISGTAHNNAIGGFQVSVEPQVTASANLGYGIAMIGKAHDNLIVNTYVGTNHNDTVALGNAEGGIFLGPGTSSNTIGGKSSLLQVKIVDNDGSGLTIDSSNRNTVLGDDIQDNTGNGVTLEQAQNDTIGGSSAGAGNQIIDNQGYGLKASGKSSGTVVQGNLIEGNTEGNVNVSQPRGITVKV